MKLAQSFSGISFGEDVRWVDGWVVEVKHTQILLLFGGSVNLYSTTGLLLPLMAGKVFLVCIGCCGIMLTSVTLFGRESGVGCGTRCTIYEGILIFLPYSASLNVIPGIDIVGEN